jgi:hypothetical protein
LGTGGTDAMMKECRQRNPAPQVDLEAAAAHPVEGRQIARHRGRVPQAGVEHERCQPDRGGGPRHCGQGDQRRQGPREIGQHEAVEPGPFRPLGGVHRFID